MSELTHYASIALLGLDLTGVRQLWVSREFYRDYLSELRASATRMDVPWDRLRNGAELTFAGIPLIVSGELTGFQVTTKDPAMYEQPKRQTVSESRAQTERDAATETKDRAQMAEKHATSGVQREAEYDLWVKVYLTGPRIAKQSSMANAAVDEMRAYFARPADFVHVPGEDGT